MVIEVKMPKLGLTMVEGRIIEWLKKVGDRVEADEIIATIETEKLVGDVKAPASGFLAKILYEEGSKAKINETIALIAESKEELERIISGVPTQPTPTISEGKAEMAGISGVVQVKPVGKVRATPAARKLAEELGVSLDDVWRHFPDREIISQEEVKAYVEKIKSVAPKVVEAGLTVLEERTLSPMRLRIAENLIRSAREMVLTTITMEVNADRLEELRNALPKDRRPSVTAFIVKALASALRDYREFNASLEGNKLRIYRDINVGVAVALEGGLIVPVVRNADTKTVFQISAELEELAKKAREGSLSLEEVAGATITVSNLGMYDVDVFTPIIYPGHVAILGVGRIHDKVVVEPTKGFTTRKYLVLSLTFDHRVTDGARAALFLRKVREYIENPYLLVVTG
ncbi:MAG: dihydrolipoamide acetyltransferase family protein [Zestosphaera sp.]